MQLTPVISWIPVRKSNYFYCCKSRCSEDIFYIWKYCYYIYTTHWLVIWNISYVNAVNRLQSRNLVHIIKLTCIYTINKFGWGNCYHSGRVIRGRNRYNVTDEIVSFGVVLQSPIWLLQYWFSVFIVSIILGFFLLMTHHLGDQLVSFSYCSAGDALLRFVLIRYCEKYVRWYLHNGSVRSGFDTTHNATLR